MIDCLLEGTTLVLVNIDASTKDHILQQVNFISELDDLLQSYFGKNVLLGGDFNTCLNERMDKKGGTSNMQSTYNKKVKGLMGDMNLVDISRTRYPKEMKFTRRERSRGGLVQARLDFWLVSEQLSFQIKKCEIKPGIKSDHSLVKITLDLLHTQARGCSYWKFNNTLLKDQKYVKMIKNEISTIRKDVVMENKNTLWDFVKCQIRTKTISFSKQKSRENREKENNLLDRLKYLEKHITDNQEMLDEYYQTKTEWEALQTIKTDGIIFRSKVQCIELGEQNTKYFMSLEKRNYNVKYIKKLLNQSGEEIVNPENILSEQKSFYRNLYSSRQNNIDPSYKNFLSDDTLPRLNDSEHEELERDLQIEEIAKALKELPNDQTPGSDGFTSNFFKFFWPDLKELLYDSFQYSFQNGMLSADQH